VRRCRPGRSARRQGDQGQSDLGADLGVARQRHARRHLVDAHDEGTVGEFRQNLGLHRLAEHAGEGALEGLLARIGDRDDGRRARDLGQGQGVARQHWSAKNGGVRNQTP
jgi:hypothetical protein